MPEQYFQTFLKLTETFTFSESKNIVSKKEQLLKLIQQIHRMAKRKFYQMPDSFTASHEENDWIQEAVITMFECCNKYDKQRSFDHYVRFMVSRRLTDLQRKIFRTNPPTNQAFFKITQEMKRELGREPSAKEIAEHTGRLVEEVDSFLSHGVGERTVIAGLDMDQEASHGKTSTITEDRELDSYGSTNADFTEPKLNVTAEAQYIHHEARRILWLCIEKLVPEKKTLFIQHELKGVSFANLFNSINYLNISFATFKRRYQTDVYDAVKQCVTLHY